MKPQHLKIKIGLQILSDCDGIMTIAILVDNSIADIFAGDSYQLQHALERFANNQ